MDEIRRNRQVAYNKQAAICKTHARIALNDLAEHGDGISSDALKSVNSKSNDEPYEYQ